MTKTPYFDEYEALKKATTKKESDTPQTIEDIKDQIISIIDHCNTEFIMRDSQIKEVDEYLQYLKRFNNIQNYALYYFNNDYLTIRIQPTPTLSYIDLSYKVV